MSGGGHFEVHPHRKPVPEGSPEGTKGEKTGEYGWRHRAANGKIDATGAEGYSSRSAANDGLHRFLTAVASVEPHPPIIDSDD